MNGTLVRSGLAALALGGVLTTATTVPALADGKTTTRDIIYGVAAAAAAITLYNVEQKHHAASTIQGYLPDGSAVYQDGRVVSPNGSSWYPAGNGESVACSNGYCTLSGGYGYGGNSNTGNYNGGYYNGGYYNGSYGYEYGQSRARRGH